MAAPQPTIDWNFLDVSMSIVGSAESIGPVAKGRSAPRASSRLRSAVVIHTPTDRVRDTGARRAAGTQATAASATRTAAAASADVVTVDVVDTAPDGLGG
jgi:hypothetical protein